MNVSQVSNAHLLDSADQIQIHPGLDFSRGGKNDFKIESYSVVERLLQMDNGPTANAGGVVNITIAPELACVDFGRTNLEFDIQLAKGCQIFNVMDLISYINIYINGSPVSREEKRNLLSRKIYRHAVSEEMDNSLGSIDLGANQGPNQFGQTVSVSVAMTQLSNWFAELRPSYLPLLKADIRCEIGFESAQTALVSNVQPGNEAYSISDLKLFTTFIRPLPEWCNRFLQEPYVAMRSNVINHSVEVSSAQKQYLSINLPKMSSALKLIMIPRLEKDTSDPSKDSFNSYPGSEFQMAALPDDIAIRPLTSVAQVYRNNALTFGSGGAFVNLKTLLGTSQVKDGTLGTYHSDFVISYCAEAIKTNHELAANVNASFSSSGDRIHFNVFFKNPPQQQITWDIFMIGIQQVILRRDRSVGIVS